MGKQRTASGIVAGHDRGRDKGGDGAGGGISTRHVALISLLDAALAAGLIQRIAERSRSAVSRYCCEESAMNSRKRRL